MTKQTHPSHANASSSAYSSDSSSASAFLTNKMPSSFIGSSAAANENNLHVAFFPPLILMGTGLWCYNWGIPKMEQAQNKYMATLLQDIVTNEQHYSTTTPRSSTTTTTTNNNTNTKQVAKTVLRACSSYMNTFKATGYFYQTYPLMMVTTLAVTCCMPRSATFLAGMYAHGIYGLLRRSVTEIENGKSSSSSSSSSSMTMMEERPHGDLLEPFADITLISPNMEILFALMTSSAMAIVCFAKSLFLLSRQTS